MKEKIDVHDGGDDREVGDDDELLDSPSHKKPRRDIFAEEKHEADKKPDEENEELHDKSLMDTASITDDESEQESLHSYISTLPPEVPSFPLLQVRSTPSSTLHESDQRRACLLVQLVMRVFHYLPVKELARAAQTCSLWYSLAQEDQLWRSLYNVRPSPLLSDAHASPEL
jgi:hypothetical protein